ncbi:hypothetical protein LCGC14_1254070 [marine sediment metagenome]|uniref:Tyr recombinase domain-containing protein n=1 Tax=marine sediment metagenome TaxID=412755 RepID=A0A0F9NJ89_9ZZZZ
MELTDLTPELYERIELAASNLRDKLLIRFLGRLGCRVSEALGVEVPDVNFTREIVIVAKTSTYYHRLVPVDRETLIMLRAFFNVGGPVSKKGKTLIFGINRHRAWQIVKECAERANLPKLENRETGLMHNISPALLREIFAPPKYQIARKKMETD